MLGALCLSTFQPGNASRQEGPLIHLGFPKPVWDLAPRRGWVNSCEMSEYMSERVRKELDPQIFTECLSYARHFGVRSE